MFRVVQYINHMRALHPRRIVNARVLEARHLAELLRAVLGQELHVILRTEMQAPRRARFDARRLEARAHPVHTQRALKDFPRRRAELRDVERTAGHAVAAADALLLLEIDDPIHILNDRSVRRARGQTSWI